MAAFIILKRSGALVCKKAKWMSPPWLYSLAMADGVWWGRVLAAALANSPRWGRRNRRSWCNHCQEWIRALGARAHDQGSLRSHGQTSHSGAIGEQSTGEHAAKGKWRGWCICPRVWSASSLLILGRQRGNQALAWVTHANTLWDLGRHPFLLWASVSSSLQMRKWYKDIRKRLLPLPTPLEIFIGIISCPLERTATLKGSGGNSAPIVFQILREEWGAVGLFQLCLHLKWQSA